MIFPIFPKIYRDFSDFCRDFLAALNITGMAACDCMGLTYGNILTVATARIAGGEFNRIR